MNKINELLQKQQDQALKLANGMIKRANEQFKKDNDFKSYRLTAVSLQDLDFGEIMLTVTVERSINFNATQFAKIEFKAFESTKDFLAYVSESRNGFSRMIKQRLLKAVYTTQAIEKTIDQLKQANHLPKDFTLNLTFN